MTLSFAALEQLWVNAGGPPAVAPIAAAIAKAESFGGDPTATNPNDNGGTQTSWGLWQISDGTHNAFANWNDPATNAAAAVAKYKAAISAGKDGFSPWGTYTTKAYLPFLQSSSVPVAAATTTGTASAASAGGSVATATFSPVALSPTVTTLILVGAAVLLVLALLAVSRQQKAAPNVVG